MKNQIVNGYKIPSGQGGVAVRRACEFVVENPGIKQADLLAEAVRFSGLYAGTAGWITSPSEKSPAGILWSREKVGRSFSCFPNESTHLVKDSAKFAFEIQIKAARKDLAMWRAPLKPGDLIRYEPISSYYKYKPETGIYLGLRYDGKLFNSIEEIEADPSIFKPGISITFEVLDQSGKPTFAFASAMRPAADG